MARAYRSASGPLLKERRRNAMSFSASVLPRSFTRRLRSYRVPRMPERLRSKSTRPLRIRMRTSRSNFEGLPGLYCRTCCNGFGESPPAATCASMPGTARFRAAALCQPRADFPPGKRSVLGPLQRRRSVVSNADPTAAVPGKDGRGDHGCAPAYAGAGLPEPQSLMQPLLKGLLAKELCDRFQTCADLASGIG